MLRPRIIPCLLVHNGGLVKTVEFKDSKYVGDPINAVKIFNEKETDELMVVDIDATKNGCEPNFKMIADLAAECRMPLAYGGGIKTAAQAKRIIGLGVEKVAISSAAITDPSLITRAADEIGSQSVVVVLDINKSASGDAYEVWTHNATRNTKLCPFKMAEEAQALGAGEIVLNSIAHDGKMKGYDLALATAMRARIDLPMTILGGAGSLADLGKLIAACGIVGAAAGSLFVFKGPFRAVLINYPNQQQKDDLIRVALHANTSNH
ncbi:putative imidazole glycerol phosphate synthase subunit hisF2 [Geothrix oryzae]|uniref:imidazole glycerol-phosphate synthase n=1 Tax=Geothrix oryzae TaxID=2927975 RepID=A0ABM8DTU4_9BACT|nr:AglZ/HisF2 family acetamidino modification protein [Geothrix oryzae]BDU70452.1 putative imidazole glycerol phosphate synthase subunit hisF2 [Geothrix oryzae]